MTEYAKIKDEWLGKTVRDRATGFTGVAHARVQMFNGSIMYLIQPKCTEDNKGALPEGHQLDAHMLEEIDIGVWESSTPYPTGLPFEIGNHVRDKATGYAGTIISHNVFINGCVYFGVSAMNFDTGKPHEHLCDWNRLELCESPGTKVEPPKPPEGKKSPGGPMRRGRLKIGG